MSITLSDSAAARVNTFLANRGKRGLACVWA